MFQSYADKHKVGALQAHEEDIIEAAKPVLQGWSVALDSDLIALARRRTENTKKPFGSSGLNMSLRGLWLVNSQEDMRYSVRGTGTPQLPTLPQPLTRFQPFPKQRIAGRPFAQVRLRYEILRLYNQWLLTMVHALDINATRPWSTGYMMRSLSHCIFQDLKDKILAAALSATKSSKRCPSLKLDNYKASKSEDSKEFDIETSHCIFEQAYQQLKKETGESFRY